MSAFPGATTPNVGPDYYESSSTWSKEILVTKDPVFVNRTVINGHYIGRKPHNYLPLAIVATILNPLIGPIAIVFAIMSTRSYYDGDMKYAEKWADHAFMIAMATLGITIILAVAIGFTLSNVGTKGGHAP
ncbi:transmembrane protein 233-like [Crassostrea angulata]|nr:transmembrane protein 233 isoform X2 [Crassostrea gigas]XP_052709182.1 transmembrane protein 233-like [Crassostrea angulata]|eukprot:XP_011436994.1 PREDICTED: transmembrane protein 233 isoform X2 [Crassostrea gigas]